MAGTDQYTVWDTDSSGRFSGNPIGVVAGSSTALEALEPSFQQDLNGDGIVGVPSAIGSSMTIERNGSTWLTEVRNQFYLYDASGSGPALTFFGTVVTVGAYGGWTPIGAEQTASGYEVAWKMAGADQYTVWDTDSSGNFSGNPIGVVPGATAALEALEPSFQQDLNGDGVIGVPGASTASQDVVLSDQQMSAPSIFSFASGASGANNVVPPLPSQVLATGDFLGDGNSDLLWLGANNTPELSEMRDGSLVDTVSLPTPPSSWQLVGGADLDGNGKPDILWQNSDGAVRSWDLSAIGTITTAVPGNPGAAWQLTGAADVNGDGKSDLLFVNAATNQQQIWLMNGSQVASAQTAPIDNPTTQPNNPVLGKIDACYAGGASTNSSTGDTAAGTGQIGLLDASVGDTTGRFFART
jgi:hypothetical protein